MESVIGSVIGVIDQMTYRVRVFESDEASEVAGLPSHGAFVRVGETVAGVVVNTRIVPPPLEQLGLDAESMERIRLFAPDLLSQVTKMVDVVGVAEMTNDTWTPGVPRNVPEIWSKVYPMTHEQIRAAHGEPPIFSYLPPILASPERCHRAGGMAAVKTLIEVFPELQRELELILAALRWTQAFGGGI